MTDIYKSEEHKTGEEKPVKEAEKKTTKISLTKGEKTRPEKLKQIRQEVYRLVGEKGNGMSSFFARPRNFRFETQMTKEKIILVLRRHWVTNLGWVATLLVMAIAPVFFKALPPFSLLPTRFDLVITLLWYLFVFAIFMERFFCWYFGVNIITDERIIDVDLVSLIYKKISDADIENIEDVTYKMGGLLGTVFNFGTLYVQTAAQQREFEFEKIPNPALVAKVLQNLRVEEKQEAIEGRVS